jgi:hypothetical protein
VVVVEEEDDVVVMVVEEEEEEDEEENDLRYVSAGDRPFVTNCKGIDLWAQVIDTKEEHIQGPCGGGGRGRTRGEGIWRCFT